MLLKHLSIKSLYGYLSKEVPLNERITLLVGINGSGKTSVLNVVNWLIRPSMADLCMTVFEELKLTFTLRDSEYEIQCTQANNKVLLKVSGNENDLAPLEVNLLVPPGTGRVFTDDGRGKSARGCPVPAALPKCIFRTHG